MIKRTARIVVYAVGALIAVVAVGLAFAAWRLSQGPVSLAFLTPVVERAVNDPSNSFQIRLGDTVLTWIGHERAVDLRFVDVRAVDQEGGVIANVPELALDLDVKALLQGVIAPVEIELYRPSVWLRRQLDGRLDVRFGREGAGSGSVFGPLLSDLLAAPQPDRPMSYLETLRIIDAEVTLEDEALGISWKGSSRQVRLWHEGTSIRAEAFLAVALDGERAELAMTGQYHAPDDRLDLGVSFDELRPAAFARVAPPLKPLEVIDLPLRGTITLTMDGAGRIDGIGFDLNGGSGTIALPEALAEDIGMPTPALRLSVRSAELHGRYDRTGPTIDIDHVNISLEEGATVFVPAPIDHEFPVVSVTGKGRYLGEVGRVEVDNVTIELAGPTVTVAGAADAVGSEISGQVSVTVSDLKVDELPLYWPRAVKTNTRAWVAASLSEGVVPEARFDLAFGAGADGTDITGLAATIGIVDVTVDYLPPMPKVQKASGTATLDLKSLTVSISGGEAGEIVLSGGKVVLSGFDQTVERADIELSLEGPVRNVLELLDHEPLGYAKAMGIDPATTRGIAVGSARFAFPLLKTLGLDALDIAAEARVSGLFIENVVFGAAITDGTLDLKVDTKGLDAAGRITLESTETDLVWRENFTADAPFDSRFVLDIAAAEVAFLADLGLTLAPVIVTDMTGKFGAQLQITLLPGDTGRIEAKIDPTNAGARVPLLGWKKEIGQRASSEIVVTLDGERIGGIPRFALSAEDLQIVGEARFGAAGAESEIDLKRVVHGRTDLSGLVVLHPDGGSDILVTGRSINMEPIWTVATRGELDVDSKGGRDPKFTLTADVGRAWLGADRHIDGLTGTFVNDRGTWTLVQGDGLVGGASPIDFSIYPDQATTRTLSIEADDAGATLRTLGIFGDVVGGELRLKGTFDDGQPDQPLKGRLKVKDYRLINAPGLAQVLSIMALTGILDALRGEGIAFSKMDVPFTLCKNILEIDEGQASGSSLGVTASGTVDVAAETFDIKGTVVPFYAVNAVLGRIPVLGDILTGGEKGGGIFAALYTMRGPLNDPKVSVNPVSALAPGFLRNLFSIFDSGGNHAGTGKPREGDDADDGVPVTPQSGPTHP